MPETSFKSVVDLYPQIKNFVFLGEAGSGKSEIAINFARLLLARNRCPVDFFDLDMTKPLFRSRDQRETLEEIGIRFHFEEQFMDAPTVAGGVSRSLKDACSYTLLDVGGDYIGARSIGGYAPLLCRSDTAVFYVINPFRPWSTTLEHIDRVLGETLGVSHLSPEQLHLIANPNLGTCTTAEDVSAGEKALDEMVGPYKAFDFICVRHSLLPQAGRCLTHPILPLHLCLTYSWAV